MKPLRIWLGRLVIAWIGDAVEADIKAKARTRSDARQAAFDRISATLDGEPRAPARGSEHSAHVVPLRRSGGKS